MKYCLTYHRSTFEKNLFDEVIIKYEEENEHVVNFAQEEANSVRLVLDMRNYKGEPADSLPVIKMTTKMHSDIAVLLNLGQTDFAQVLLSEGIAFFYDKIAETWDELVSLVRAGVSDIYIGSELGFEIKDVASVCHNRNIKIRVFANVAQTSAPLKNMDTITAFFIRPEDLILYEPHIDVVEFFGPIDRQRVLHEIYTNGKWLGNLSEIIIGLDVDVKSSSIAPRFAEARLNCKKRCNQEKCTLCNNVQTFAQMLDENGLSLKREK